MWSVILPQVLEVLQRNRSEGPERSGVEDGVGVLHIANTSSAQHSRANGQ